MTGALCSSTGFSHSLPKVLHINFVDCFQPATAAVILLLVAIWDCVFCPHRSVEEISRAHVGMHCSPVLRCNYYLQNNSHIGRMSRTALHSGFMALKLVEINCLRMQLICGDVWLFLLCCGFPRKLSGLAHS